MNSQHDAASQRRGGTKTWARRSIHVPKVSAAGCHALDGRDSPTTLGECQDVAGWFSPDGPQCTVFLSDRAVRKPSSGVSWLPQRTAWTSPPRSPILVWAPRDVARSRPVSSAGPATGRCDDQGACLVDRPPDRTVFSACDRQHRANGHTGRDRAATSIPGRHGYNGIRACDRDDIAGPPAGV